MKPIYPSLSRLRALRMVCATGSFSTAAEQLLLTQPAVSSQIRQLERETGAQLIERIGKRARATPEGAVLIATATRIFDELDSALEELSSMQGETSGPLHIGAGATAATHLLPSVLAEFERANPKVEIQLTTGNTRDMLPALKRADMDIAIVTGPITENELSYAPFFSDRLFCLAPPAQVRGMKALQPADFEDKRLVLYEPGGYIRQIIDDWFSSAESRPGEVFDIGNADAQANFVRAGFGWSIISEMAGMAEAARGGVRLIPLAPPLSREIVVAWRADRGDRPAISAASGLFSMYGKTRKPLTDP